MNIVVKINGTDRTNYISWPSFQKEDIINNEVDNCTFDTKRYGSKTFKPAVGDEVEVKDGSTFIFAGVVMQVTEEIEGVLLKYRVQCKDWTHYLDRVFVVERYDDMTVEDIIANINTNYLSGFTIANVNCPITVKSITFNRLPISKCLQILAEQVNYSWYVDYEKDIHFFAKNSEIAPFNLTDTNGNYTFSSLMVKDDLSQIRNRVYVRGGEIEGASRAESYTGDGSKTTFALANKFSKKPTVTVGGVSKTVGIDFLDQDASFDCLWNYNEKYIRFVSAPAASAAVSVSGLPLYPLIVQVEDLASIAQYGVYEFSLVDKTIRTSDEAKQYASAQLEAYAKKISEASFETYESGLRSGQVVNIQSDIRGIDENYLIQRVNLVMRTPTDGLWQIELATTRTIGIIDFLQRLLLSQNKQIVVSENEVIEKYFLDYQDIETEEVITLKTIDHVDETVEVTEEIEKDPFGPGVPPDWVWSPYKPTSNSDPKREGYWDKAYWQ